MKYVKATGFIGSIIFLMVLSGCVGSGGNFLKGVTGAEGNTAFVPATVPDTWEQKKAEAFTEDNLKTATPQTQPAVMAHDPERTTAVPETDSSGAGIMNTEKKDESTTRSEKKKQKVVSDNAYESKRLSENRMPGKVPESDPGGEKGELVFNFDDADLYEVIRIMAEILNINYLIDPGVTGKVTIQTAGSLKPTDILPIFHQILEINGLAAVTEGSLVKIVKIDEVGHLPLTPLTGGGRILQLIPLKYVTADEMTKLVTPFLSAKGVAMANAATNTLLIVDREINMTKLVDLARIFDVDVFERIQHRFYKLTYIEAEEAAKTLEKILGTKQAGDVYTFIPIERLNTLIVMCKEPRGFEYVEALLEKLDEYSDSAEPRIYVYKVRNGSAEELQTLLTAVFVKKSGKQEKKTLEVLQENASTKKEEAGKEKVELFPKKTVEKTTQTPAASSGAVEGTSGTLRGEVKITADKITNALIIEAFPSDYRIVTNILEQVDVLPRQVLIEVIIAEIRLDDKTKLGIEWSYDSTIKDSDKAIVGALGASGLGLNVGFSDKLNADISAFAENQNVNVISTPRILASDNMKASINISTQVPVASTTYNYNDSNDGVFQTNIQYRDTGVILGVTPRINDRGLVSMEISQEVSDSAGAVEIGGSSYSSFLERKVETSLTVANGQTIVLGGLMRETDEKDKRGLPVLSRLPFLGFLFGQDSNTVQKSELIILIRPTVIKTLDDVDYVTQEFKHRVSAAMKPAVHGKQ